MNHQTIGPDLSVDIGINRTKLHKGGGVIQLEHISWDHVYKWWQTDFETTHTNLYLFLVNKLSGNNGNRKTAKSEVAMPYLYKIFWLRTIGCVLNASTAPHKMPSWITQMDVMML